MKHALTHKTIPMAMCKVTRDQSPEERGLDHDRFGDFVHALTWPNFTSNCLVQRE